MHEIITRQSGKYFVTISAQCAALLRKKDISTVVLSFLCSSKIFSSNISGEKVPCAKLQCLSYLGFSVCLCIIDNCLRLCIDLCIFYLCLCVFMYSVYFVCLLWVCVFVFVCLCIYVCMYVCVVLFNVYVSVGLCFLCFVSFYVSRASYNALCNARIELRVLCFAGLIHFYRCNHFQDTFLIWPLQI